MISSKHSLAILLATSLLAGVSGAAVGGEAPIGRGAADATTPAGEAGALHRLPSLGRSLRFTGESDQVTFPLFVGANDAGRSARLRLAHVVAVSVMPEASHLAVAINDRAIGDTALGAGNGPRTAELAVPAGVLKPGWNAVRISVEQRHRVDCSIASTYELWTEIDRSRSGFVFATGTAGERRDLADLAGVAPDARGRVAVRLVVAETGDPRRMERAMRAAEALALIGGWLDPVVSVVRRPEAGPGVDVLIGRAAGAASDALAGSATVVDDGDPERLTVVLPGDDQAVERAVAELEQAAREAPIGSEAGIAARAGLGGRAIASGERVRLGALGAVTSEFSGRLFRTGFDVRLPADLYAADYAKVKLKLAGGHAPGLDRTARLSVRVNGRLAAGMPIAAPQGEVFTDRTLQVPLSAFRPGHNRIEIEASVPNAADKACEAAAQIDGAKRFLFVDRSELVFPTFARLARLPDLSATASGVLAELDAANRPALYLPHPDAAGLSAAATLLTRMAVAQGRIDVPALSFRNPSVDAPSAIVVGAFSDLPTTVIGAVGLEPGQVRAAWGRRPNGETPVAQGGDGLTRRLSGLKAARLAGDVDPIVTGSLQNRVPSVAAPKDGDPVDRWRKSMESPWSPAAFTRAAGARLEKLFDFLPTTGERRPFEGLATTPTTGLVVAQAMSPAGGAWTLVTAPSSAVLSDAVATLTGGETWSRLEGAATSWDQADDKLASVPAAHVGFLATAGFDLANIRLVAAALASDYPFVYILAALLITAGLGFATARLLPHLGGKRA